jgi:hypothetical protein
MKDRTVPAVPSGRSLKDRDTDFYKSIPIRPPSRRFFDESPSRRILRKDVLDALDTFYHLHHLLPSASVKRARDYNDRFAGKSTRLRRLHGMQRGVIVRHLRTVYLTGANL